MADSLKASTRGIERVDLARRKKKWNRTAAAWYKEAFTSRATLNRFWARQPIRRATFIAICAAVGLEWQTVAETEAGETDRQTADPAALTEPAPNDPQPTHPSGPGKKPQTEGDDAARSRGLYIPNARCRRIWGRTPLIEKILHSLSDPQELSILSLSGGAGYGKTEVAGQVAKAALAQNYFADVLWVTARQTELVDGRISQAGQYDVLNWNKFLHEIAHQLACPVEKVQQHLKSDRLLVVLDNAETAAIEDILCQLVRFLEPSRALLTSRLKTKPPYVKLLPIQGLEQQWSHRLLRHEAACSDIPALLQASDDDLDRIHQLSCGAPLALHFVVGRVLHDCSLDPVLVELDQASGQVEPFYQFCLETTWQRIGTAAKDVLRYMGRVDAGVTRAELMGAWKLPDSSLNMALSELRRWYFLEDQQDVKGNWRFTLHPWVRSSLRSGLVETWQPSLQELEQIAAWKFEV